MLSWVEARVTRLVNVDIQLCKHSRERTPAPPQHLFSKKKTSVDPIERGGAKF